MTHLIFLILYSVSTCLPNNKTDENSILGSWVNNEKTLKVVVYKLDNEFRAKITWFDDSDDKTHPTATRCDYNNPNPALRSRKVVGLEIMKGLHYNATKNQWVGGIIYDPSSGKEWNAKISLASATSIEVRGFWHVEFLGQNLGFTKYNPQ